MAVIVLPNEQGKSLGQGAGLRRNNSNGSLSSLSDSSSTSGSSNKNSQHKKCRRRRGRNKKRQRPSTPPPPPPPPSLSLEEQAEYVAMDAEMVGVGPHGCQSALARITMVDWNNEIIYDRFIRPDRHITDYRTFVSGITEADLFDNKEAVDLATCRQEVLDILDGKVLVGHALKNDMKALGIQHCWQKTRDTAKYEPFMKIRFDDGILWPRKLKELCQEKLQREIQRPGQPHSAYEDALAALDLYKMVRTKWEKVMDYKINKTAQIAQQHAAKVQ
jgi:RNA exonuclease 4